MFKIQEYQLLLQVKYFLEMFRVFREIMITSEKERRMMDLFLDQKSYVSFQKNKFQHLATNFESS